MQLLVAFLLLALCLVPIPPALLWVPQASLLARPWEALLLLLTVDLEVASIVPTVVRPRANSAPILADDGSISPIQRINLVASQLCMLPAHAQLDPQCLVCLSLQPL